MKNTIKFILFFVAILAIVLIVPNISEASTSVNSEETLLNAIRLITMLVKNDNTTKNIKENK